MDKLRISDNGRYFVRSDNSPFIWLADTAWTVPARLKWDDVQYYMKTRKAQGFTVLQMVVIDPEYNTDMRNPCGVRALRDHDLLQPEEAYFSYVDYVLDQAEEYGFYVLLLPVWGELVVGWGWDGSTREKIVTEENAFSYGKWLGSRYRSRNNILWCLGGDRMPVTRGVDYRPVWRELAEGLSEGLTGKRLRYHADREEWRKLLLTYHACHEQETGLCSTFSYWTPEDAWIGFTMLQSGHGLYKKNYDLVAEEREVKEIPGSNEKLVYPVWDGEPAYEMMPTTWPVTDEDSFHATYMVRKRAYWALFSGAFGHTYGHASVWCTATQKEKNAICRLTWDEAIHSEGSGQMKILRDFMEAYPLNEFEPCRDRLLRQASGEDMLDLHEEALINHSKRQMLVYFAADTEEQIDITALLESPYDKVIYGAWFNPSDGSMTDTQEFAVFRDESGRTILKEKNEMSVTGDEEHSFSQDKDRILILAQKSEEIRVPSLCYGEEASRKEATKVFEW